MLLTVSKLIPVNVTRIRKLVYHQVKERMTNPTSFQNSNYISRKHSLEALNEFSSKIKWKKQPAKILDVGSGDGGVTSDVLKSYIPRNFEKLLGVDVSPEMVTHANLHHKEDRVEFKLMDIAESAADLVEQFDHIFSFFALQWIQDQEKALSNIYSMLTPGGDCVFVVLCCIPIYDTFRVLATKPAWSQYMNDAEQYISPYHDSQNPEEEFTNLMNKCGFLDVDVRHKESFYDFGELEIRKRLAIAVNPFVDRIPSTLRESFIDEYMKELNLKMDSVYAVRNNHKRGKFELFHTVLYAYGSK